MPVVFFNRLVAISSAHFDWLLCHFVPMLMTFAVRHDQRLYYSTAVKCIESFSGPACHLHEWVDRSMVHALYVTLYVNGCDLIVNLLVNGDGFINRLKPEFRSKVHWIQTCYTH